MSATLNQINTGFTGDGGSNATISGSDGGNGAGVNEFFNDQDFAPLNIKNPAAYLMLTPGISGGVGGNAMAGTVGTASTETVTGSSINGFTINTYYAFSSAGNGQIGGSGGAAGSSFLLLQNDTLGTVADPYTADDDKIGITLSAGSLIGGGKGANGGFGGDGGGSADYSDFRNSLTYYTVSLGAAGGDGGRGGNGGAGGNTEAELTGFTSDVGDAFGNAGDGTGISLLSSASNGGAAGDGAGGGDGSKGGHGGVGGVGGEGGSAVALFTNSTVIDQVAINVDLLAVAGAGGAGGQGSDDGEGFSHTMFGNFNSPGGGRPGGSGGDAGSAQVTLSTNFLIAPDINLSLFASGSTGGTGGLGGPNKGASASSGGNTSGFLSMTDNIIDVVNTVGSDGTVALIMRSSNFNPAPNAGDTYVKLNGGTGGNLVFSGNQFIGTGRSELILNQIAKGTGTPVTVDVSAGTISIDGSPGNSISGFDEFILGPNDVLKAGPGTNIMQVVSDPDTLVYYPTSGKVIVSGDETGSLILDFQGFGASLNAAAVQANTTISNGNTYIEINGHSIELEGYVSSIPTTSLQFDPGPVAPIITNRDGAPVVLATQAEQPVSPFTSYAVVDNNAGATDTLTISFSGGTLSGEGINGGNGSYTLTGTAAAVTTDLTALYFTPAKGAAGSSTTTVFTLTDTSSAGASSNTQTASVTDTDAAACFAAGTRILTLQGEIAVENLRVGDIVLLRHGGAAPIIWIGHRSLNLLKHPFPENVQPIRIAAGALASGVPSRDLAVSPDHAFYMAGHLVPAKALLNGHSIRQLSCAAITYYHVELASHDVLFAEGAPAETYLETGNRGAFVNGTTEVILHPDFAQAKRESTGCAPFVEDGPVVEAIRHDILALAGIQTTADPKISVRYQNGDAIIESSSAIPGHISPDPRDRRRLGVKIAKLEISGGVVPLDHPKLQTGWHALEPDGRWTNGKAVIPGSLLKNSKLEGIILAATMAYPVQEQGKGFLAATA